MNISRAGSCCSGRITLSHLLGVGEELKTLKDFPQTLQRVGHGYPKCAGDNHYFAASTASGQSAES